MKIDVQCHVFPEVYGDFLVKNAKSFKAKKEDGDFFFDFNGAQILVMARRQFDPVTILAAMDKAGVDMSLISCNIPDPGLLPPDLAAEGCRLANSGVKELIEKYPGRFCGSAFLPWNRPDEALHELESVAQNGFCSVILFSHNGGIHTDDSALEPVYARCAELRLPIVLHPGIPLWAEHIGAYGMVATVSFVIDTVFALLRMVYSGVLERNAALKLVMPHLGGVLPFLDGRLGYVPENAKPSGISGQDLVRFIRSGPNIWYDFSNPSINVVNYALSYFTADKVVFGSDYPYVAQSYLTEMIDGMDLSRDDKEKIYWRNANEIFGLGLA